MKTHTLKKIEQLLKQSELKKTRQRINILKVLFDAKRPLTQEDIAKQLHSSAPNKVTIYRCMESFIDAGLVHRAYLEDRTWHYELGHHCSEIQCHPHFTCTKCGLTQCMVGSSVSMVKDLDKGFVVHRQQVRLEGLCPKCA